MATATAKSVPYWPSWQLPEVVIDALNYQHSPFDNNAYEPLAGVLHLAAWRARARVKWAWTTEKWRSPFPIKWVCLWGWTLIWCCSKTRSTGRRAPMPATLSDVNLF